MCRLELWGWRVVNLEEGGFGVWRVFPGRFSLEVRCICGKFGFAGG